MYCRVTDKNTALLSSMRPAPRQLEMYSTLNFGNYKYHLQCAGPWIAQFNAEIPTAAEMPPMSKAECRHVARLQGHSLF